MQITQEQVTPTKVKLTLVADADQLSKTKHTVLHKLAPTVKVPGFRAGKAPLSVIEKSLDPASLQSEFLDAAVNELYVAALDDKKLRPVNSPDVSITKFVPFSTLEVTAEVEVIGKVVLPDYTKIKLAPKPVKVDASDVDEVIENLRTRAAEKTDVVRAAKTGDEVTIDFKGVDTKTKQPVAGADGTDYPLVLGSDSFIPGFEAELIGLKPDATKTFDIVFPDNYATQALQGKKVTFTVSVKNIQELTKPKADDAFAATIGPFKTLAELKTDIKRQLTADRQQQARQDYQSELLGAIAEKTKADIPQILIDDELERIEADERQNLMYRGQTWEEHLKAEGVTEKEHRERERAGAQARVTAGLVLGEVADREGITVTPQEVNLRIKLLKGQYTDEAMQAELDKPENRRDLQNRMLTEKTIDKLTEYASK